jgi:DNA-binding MarR family transcriptional regulator
MSKPYYNVETYTARDSVGYLLRRAKTLIQDALEPGLAQHGFTFTQYIVLAWLREGICKTAKDICRELRHDSGALARVIDQLAERGLIERMRDLEDRRKVELCLTPLGHETFEQLLPTVVNKMNWSLTDLTRDESAELLRLLAKLNASMESNLHLATAAPSTSKD